MNSLDKARNIINKVDEKMAELFCERMRASEMVAQYKKEYGLEIYDKNREEEVIKRNSELISDATLREYYVDFLNGTMSLSKKYQSAILSTKEGCSHKSQDSSYPDFTGTVLKMSLGERSYDILVGGGLLDSADRFLNLDRKVFILTDTGVPKEYSEKVLEKASQAVIFTVKEGEPSKNLATLTKILEVMLEFEMTRGDCLVAVGGGVIGDLGGLAASMYMRGIDFYNIPTTLLAQVDSSIGGKTAVNLKGVKNTVGAFYQPAAVLIDVDTLKTLPERHISAGLAESLKMALTSDAELFSILENNTALDIEDIIIRSLMIKRAVVEKDEREVGLRKILNFGHTLGHAIESDSDLNKLYHGECVALGMLPTCSDSVRARLIPVLKKLNLPTLYDGSIKRALDFIVHDKKCNSGYVDAVFVDEIGKGRIERISVEDFSKIAERYFLE